VAERDLCTPRGNGIDKKYIYRMLNSRAYIGEAVHKGESYPGEHDAIVDQETRDKVHAILQESPRKRAARTRAEMPALLRGSCSARTARPSRRPAQGRAADSTATTSARPC
jgi:site-specific DNA recombinase